MDKEKKSKITQLTALITAIGGLIAAFASWQVTDGSMEKAYDTLSPAVAANAAGLEATQENLEALRSWVQLVASQQMGVVVNDEEGVEGEEELAAEDDDEPSPRPPRVAAAAKPARAVAPPPDPEPEMVAEDASEAEGVAEEAPRKKRKPRPKALRPPKFKRPKKRAPENLPSYKDL